MPVLKDRGILTEQNHIVHRFGRPGGDRGRRHYPPLGP